MNFAERLLKKIPQYTRNARHLRSVIQHGTPRKWANLALVEAERLVRRIHVRSHPYLLILDPCNYCNLRCPLCPTGMGTLGRKQSMLSLECFKRWFDPHAPYLFEVSLHNWGESLLNPDLFRMVEYAAQANVGTNLSSNLMIARPQHLEAMVDSGLEYLIVSLDGVDQATYAPYRVRGDYERVVNNMRELLRIRNAKGSKTPVVEWQFIVMKHNQHAVADAERLAAEIGVDLIRFLPVGLPFENYDQWPELAKSWFPDSPGGQTVEQQVHEQQFGQGSRSETCFYLYRSMVINADGGVSPCCIVYRQDRDFAQAEDGAADVLNVWNNDRYRSARSLFTEQACENKVPTVCDTCNIFAHHPSKK